MSKSEPQKTADAAKDKVSGMFKKVGQHTGATNQRINEWQEKWLAVPKNRTKYESIKDVPDVMGEEVFAMFNDIIDFVQREEGGQSHVFNKLKDEGRELAKDPKAFMGGKVDQGKELAKEGMEKAKGVAASAKDKAEEVKKTMDKTAKEIKKAGK